MTYHDPSKGPPSITIWLDVVDRASPVLGRLGDSLRRLSDALDPRLHVLDELVPLVLAAAALDGGYRSLPRRIPLPATLARFVTVEHQLDGPALVDELSTSFTVPVSGVWSFSSGRGCDRQSFDRSLYVQQVRPLPTSIRCPLCGRQSRDRNDIRERYCGACHEFHDRMNLGWLP